MTARLAASGSPAAVGSGRLLARAVVGAALLALAACGNKPPIPDWQMNAKSSLDRATAAYLEGNSRLEALEFARARAELARTGRVDLLVRAELARCAARVASLVFEDCAGYEALAQDAPAAERAYAAYLAGKAGVTDVGLLPSAQRSVAAGGVTAKALGDVADPVSRLVAAGVLLRSGRAQPEVFAVAVDTASAQGWSRPLLAWLNVALKRAETAGESAEVERLKRRIDLVSNGGTPAPRSK